ncbi:hypothetical protein BEWA_030010 [Theileria equi strain WA]|uniref:Uncharacterized protein n=1 Tax=Theileria equi strain WA TaxID=1537102 RepID=L0AZ24_THEEQ|nr:hypothetical protein BEWA_030010 [Theileria equi strain WA]AFZ80149.1 hypothetical protein BEWA_030010 [Theileria equi strain WA]|eukprot:XP_004829815.1 hypothetical protein BEWA_030010 [Theileria equi strain WA]
MDVQHNGQDQPSEKEHVNRLIFQKSGGKSMPGTRLKSHSEDGQTAHSAHISDNADEDGKDPQGTRSMHGNSQGPSDNLHVDQDATKDSILGDATPSDLTLGEVTPGGSQETLDSQTSARESYYNSLFQNSEETISMLKRLFSEDMANMEEIVRSFNVDKFADFNGPSPDLNLFEWLPPEPLPDGGKSTCILPTDEHNGTSDILSSCDEITDLFHSSISLERYDYCEFPVSSYVNSTQNDLDFKISNLSSVHETLYASSDITTLTSLEKFLVQLLQPKSFYGGLTPYGRLLAFINLSYLQRHVNQLKALYNHPEMSIIRGVLTSKQEGIITRALSQTDDRGRYDDRGRVDKIRAHDRVKGSRSDHFDSWAPTQKSKYATHYISGIKHQKQRLAVLDSLSSMYKPGGEAHFPRFVCGTIDRNLVSHSETLSIPLEKSDKRNIHLQFEKIEPFEGIEEIWPKTLLLPQVLLEGTRVQVAPLKHGAPMAWREATVASIAAGQVMMNIQSDHKERMYILRNFVPPNVPVMRLEKGYWRLMPRPIDLDTDLYIGSCLSLMESGDCVDVVVTGIFYDEDHSLIAAVKSPSDETLFEREDSGQEYETQLTCACDGHTLRVFEGKCIKRRGLRIRVHCLHDKRDRILDVDKLKGYKLNYDIQAHFDGPHDGYSIQFPSSLWVVPRNLSFLADPVGSRGPPKAGYNWLFKPKYALVMFPFSRSVDVLQDLCRLIPFLHPELNYAALCAGLWSLRSGAKQIAEQREEPTDNNKTETVSYTRSQKAAIRELTTTDVTSEVCSDLVRCPFSLTRRLFGCFPVISLWIALDTFDPESNKMPTIPTNIRVPKLASCSKCGGKVFPRSGMTRLVSPGAEAISTPSLESLSAKNTRSKDPDTANEQENEGVEKEDHSHLFTCNMEKPPAFDSSLVPGEVQVLRNLEKTEEWVKRLQLLAVGRWRITREFNASYSVDDELALSILKSPGQSAVNPKGNNEFLNQLTGLMQGVKRSKDTVIDPELYTCAIETAYEDFGNNVEVALLRGWSVFLRSQNDGWKESCNVVPREKPIIHSSNAYDVYARQVSTTEAVRHGLSKRAAQLELSRAEKRGPMATRKEILTSRRESHVGRPPLHRSESLVTKPSRRPGAPRKAKRARVLEVFDDEDEEEDEDDIRIDDDTDYCEFTDNPPRRRYISFLNWDEDFD